MADRARDNFNARGQVLPLFILVVSGLLSAAGMAIDGGHVYSAQRAAQSAADLAALAGAVDLPSSPTAAATTARAFLAKNGHAHGGSITVSVTTPFGGDSRRIEVVVERQVSTYFLPLLGITTWEVVARAVARSGATGYAIFAGRNDCPAGDAHETVTLSGSDSVVIGNVHSNSGIKVSGGSNNFNGTTTYKCNGRLENAGSGNSFTSGPTLTGLQPWPVTHVAASFACTYTVANGTDIGSDPGPWWQAPGMSSNRLRDGVYCTTGTLKLSASGLTGRITMLAKGSSGQVLVSGSNLNLTPFKNDVLAFSEGTGTDAIYMSGSDGNWQGLLYAPNGRAHVSGSGDLVVSGGIVARTVMLSGSQWSLAAAPGSAASSSLVE